MRGARMARISYVLVVFLIVSAFAPMSYARDPRAVAGLKKGLPYDNARKRLLRMGVRVAPTNLPMTNFEADKNQPEITCGYLRDSDSPKSVCAVSFENKRGDYIS